MFIDDCKINAINTRDWELRSVDGDNGVVSVIGDRLIKMSRRTYMVVTVLLRCQNASYECSIYRSIRNTRAIKLYSVFSIYRVTTMFLCRGVNSRYYEKAVKWKRRIRDQRQWFYGFRCTLLSLFDTNPRYNATLFFI